MEYTTIRLADDSALGKAGQNIRLALTPSDVAIPEEIDSFLAGYSPFGFRADEACPIVLADKDEDQFRTFGSNNAFRQVNVLSSLQAAVAEVDPETGLSTYKVKDRALGSFIPAVTEGQAAPLYDPRMAASRRIRWALDLDREIRIFGTGGLLSTTGNWPAANKTTIVGAAQWSNPTTANPVKDIQDRIEASAQMVTGVYMNPQVGHAFLRADLVRDHMRQLLGDNAPAPQTIAAAGAQTILDFVIPGLPPIHIVPGKVLNESTSALDYILGDSVILVGMPPGGVPTNGEDIMTSITWRRRGPSGTGFTSREFFVDNRGLDGGTMLVAGHAEDPQFIANNVGGLILDVLA